MHQCLSVFLYEKHEEMVYLERRVSRLLSFILPPIIIMALQVLWSLNESILWWQSWLKACYLGFLVCVVSAGSNCNVCSSGSLSVASSHEMDKMRSHWWQGVRCANEGNWVDSSFWYKFRDNEVFCITLLWGLTSWHYGRLHLLSDVRQAALPLNEVCCKVILTLAETRQVGSTGSSRNTPTEVAGFEAEA